MNESCHIWMNHITYEWVMSRMNESWHTRMTSPSFVKSSASNRSPPTIPMNYVTANKPRHSHIWMGHVTYEWAFVCVFRVWHDPSICDMTPSHVTWSKPHHMWRSLTRLQGQCLLTVTNCHLDESCHMWKKPIKRLVYTKRDLYIYIEKRPTQSISR